MRSPERGYWRRPHSLTAQVSLRMALMRRSNTAQASADRSHIFCSYFGRCKGRE